jgi:hypothetical protein
VLRFGQACEAVTNCDKLKRLTVDDEWSPMIFCCSQKLQKLLGLKEKNLSPPLADEAAEWYCNLAFFERRKCLIFTHGSTLYTILVLDVKKADLADFGGLFRRRLNAMLLLDNFSREHRELLTRDAPDSFAKATDRGVIGSMVDHVRICRHLIAHEGGLGRIDVDKLNRFLNQTPMSLIGMEYALDTMRSFLEAKRDAATAPDVDRLREKGAAKPKNVKKTKPAARRCGLCGKTGKLRKTECCGNWICDDGAKYVLFSYARNSCARNHGRLTLCAFHHNEGHADDWNECARCRESFETEMYVWYGTNEYNFDKLPNPPSYAPTKCSKCGAVIKLGTEGFTQRGAEYLCEPCSEKEMAKLFQKTSPRGGPQAGGRRRK